MTKTPELLPCPFCGGKAVMVRAIPRVPNIEVFCKKCKGGFQKSLTNEFEIAKLWNKRAYPQEVKKLIQRDKPQKPDNITPKDGYRIGLCKACGTPIDNGDRFCRICGQKLDWSDYE